MKPSLLIIAILLVVACSAKEEVVTNTEGDADRLVIARLVAAGSDLSKPHSTNYYLYFPEEASARAAAADLDKARYSVDRVALASKGREWGVRAFKLTVPSAAEMKKVSAFLT